MTQFTDIPNEIMALIAQNVHPRDIVNFSCTSKFIHSLCEPSLKVHHEMERKYKKRKWTWKPNAMAYLLSDLILQPTAALYVECLKIKATCSSWEVMEHRTGPSHPMYPEETKARLTQEIADTVPLEQVSRWTKALESGDEDPVLALLLLRLPGITTLDLKIGIPLPCLFQTMVLRLEAPGVPVFSALTTLCLNWEYYADSEWQDISHFAILPSLRSMTIKNFLHDRGGSDSSCLLQPRSSNVTSISIKDSEFPGPLQYQLLRGFKALRRFSYENSFILQDPVCTHSALLAHCKASLEYLSSAISSGHSYIGCLRDFENLKEVVTYRSHLLDKWNSPSQDLAQALPASIEKVHLHDNFYATSKYIQNMILNAAKDKHKYLPNLQELRFSLHADARDLDSEDMAVVVHMQAKCEEAGFKLTID